MIKLSHFNVLMSLAILIMIADKPNLRWESIRIKNQDMATNATHDLTPSDIKPLGSQTNYPITIRGSTATNV